ncbi:hypothetical protein P7C70_g5231, partial [Phenoliferia sp. Uapishka_3]
MVTLDFPRTYTHHAGSPKLHLGGSGRRLSRRLGTLLAAVAALALLELWWVYGDGGKRRGEVEWDSRDAEEMLVRLLVRTEDAMERERSVEEIADYADRFIVLKELDAFSKNLSATFPLMNSSQSLLFRRTLDYQHDELFSRLFPYISRSQDRKRSFGELRARYTRPAAILIPCGKDQFQYAVHLVATLKHVHKTQLPIQVAYAGNDDLPSDRRAALRSIHPDVETLDVLNYFDEELVGLRGGGWAIKVFAILASEYQQIISMDADAVWFQDPETVLGEPGYVETGTLFYRDREIFPGPGQVHEWWRGIMKGRTPSQEMSKSRWWNDMASREEMESGVVVFDKRRINVVRGLVLTGYLNTKPVREPVTYKYTYGDKESFWMVQPIWAYYFAPTWLMILSFRPSSWAKYHITSTNPSQR